MDIYDVFLYLVLWSLIGIFIANIFYIIVFRTGIVWTSRNKDGLLKKKIQISGIFAMLTILIGIIGLQIISNYFGLKLNNIKITFLSLFFVNYVYYYILLLYDTIVMDYLILVVWRLRFLKIPETLNWKSMKKHIVLSFPIGSIVGLLLTLISTTISYFFIFN
jgi:hypothetical protein